MEEKETQEFFSRNADPEIAEHLSYLHEIDDRKDIENIVSFYQKACPEISDRKISVEIKKNQPKTLAGTCFPDLSKIHLYPIGMNAGVLIHEIAHFWHLGHGSDFMSVWKDLFKMYDSGHKLINSLYFREAMDLLESVENYPNIDIESEIVDYVEDFKEDGKNINLDIFRNIVLGLKSVFDRK